MEENPVNSPSQPGAGSLGTEKVYMFCCPYLGTLEDPDTSLAYPASANHCFRLKSTAAVDLVHQESYCLTDRHPGCHIFQQAAVAPAEAEEEVMISVVEPSKRRQRLSIYALPLILILVLLAAIIWWPEPGTTIQESLAFGAADQEEISAVNELNADLSKPIMEAEAVEFENSQIEGDSSATDISLNTVTGEIVEEAASELGLETAGSASTTGETVDEATQTEEQTAGVEDASQESAAGESAVNAIAAVGENTAVEESDSVQDVETAVGAVADVTEERNAAAAEIEAVEVMEPEAGAIAEVDLAEQNAAEVGAENAAADVDQPRIVLADLPILSADTAALLAAAPAGVINAPATTAPNALPAPDGMAATSSAGERLAYIGPDVNTPPALREANKDVEALFVRQSPGIDTEMLALITRRQQAAVLGRDSSGAWIKVRLESGLEGWVEAVESRAGIAVSGLPLADAAADTQTEAANAGEAPSPAAAAVVSSLPVIKPAVVNTGALNLRSGPGVGYEPITIIYSGQTVGLLGRRGAGVWVRVRLDNGLEGWVNSSLLSPLS